MGEVSDRALWSFHDGRRSPTEPFGLSTLGEVSDRALFVSVGDLDEQERRSCRSGLFICVLAKRVV